MSKVLKITAARVLTAAHRCPSAALILEDLFPEAFTPKFTPMDNLILEGPEEMLYLMKLYGDTGDRYSAFYLYALGNAPRIRWADLTKNQQRAYKVWEGTLYCNGSGKIRWEKYR